jgi:hypothetical protein
MRAESEAAGLLADDEEDTDLIKYERGLPFRNVLRATLLRFLPGATATLAGGLVLMGGSLFSLESLAVIAGGAGLLSLGFGAALEILRRWLYPDVELDGRRSFVAGLVSPFGAFIMGVLAGPVIAANVFGFLFLPALIIGIVMFCAWLSPTPEEMRGSEYEGSLDGL